jgi:hypothetical protein
LDYNHLSGFFYSNAGDKFSCPYCIYPEGSNLLPDIDNDSDSILEKAASDFLYRSVPNRGIAVTAIGLGYPSVSLFYKYLGVRTSFWKLSINSLSEVLLNLIFVGIS